MDRIRISILKQETIEFKSFGYRNKGYFLLLLSEVDILERVSDNKGMEKICVSSRERKLNNKSFSRGVNVCSVCTGFDFLDFHLLVCFVEMGILCLYSF